MDRTERTRPSTRQRLLAVCTATVLAVPGLAALSSAARAADADLVRNGGFEAGLDGWTCTAGAVVNSPVRSGSSALQATPVGQRQRAVLPDGDRQTRLPVHPRRIRPRQLRLPRRERHRHHRRLHLDPVRPRLAAAHHHLPHRPVHHQGHPLHPRLVRHRRVLRRRRLPRGPRRRPGTAPGRAHRPGHAARSRPPPSPCPGHRSPVRRATPSTATG